MTSEKTTSEGQSSTLVEMRGWGPGPENPKEGLREQGQGEMSRLRQLQQGNKATVLTRKSKFPYGFSF